MIGKILTAIFGSRNERELKKLWPVVEQVNSLEPEFEKMSDTSLREKTAELKDRLSHGETLDDILPEAFASIREAGKRTIGQRHFDVQILGGIVLHQGKIAEMITGEGKTLVASLPVYLNALEGRGVHVVTVNDYLAERDSFGRGNFKGMGNIYQFLGLTVGCIKHGIDNEARRAAYNCDITYGTNNEFGFDYLRDNMVVSAEDMVQREHNYAIVDEVDSILIDESRTPLIISGPAEESTEKYYQIDRIIPQLKAGDDYQVEEKTRTVALTEEGVAKAEKLLKVPNLYDPVYMEIVHHINQGLKAHTLFKKDVDYIIKDGEVVIVDEFTGRLMPGRRWSDGLHQAVEAKENVEIARENQTLATITLQNYFRMYRKLAGMTGTAATEAGEFMEIYKLDVIQVPPNKPLIRMDCADVIYKTRREKVRAFVDEIAKLNTEGRPVLVGTISIEKNEEVSAMLKRRGVKHEVLNAKYHEREAEIIAMAGQPGAVTVATNMAGRGTDIVLGPGVAAKGGLHVLGTERHEARRIDNQLRGRCGRQGDPGSSRFYLSLEDDLMRIFGSDRVKGLMERMGMEEGQEITHPWVTKAIERSQKTVEGHNFDIRKHLLEYDDVMNKQREVIYSQRRTVLEGKDITDYITRWIGEMVEERIELFAPAKTYPEEWNYEELNKWMQGLASSLRVKKENFIKPGMTPDVLRDVIVDMIKTAYQERERILGADMMRRMERIIMLHSIDTKWKDHLYMMDQLKEGIGLRGYGGKDPLVEYKREGYEMFVDMINRVKEEVISFMFKVQLPKEEQIRSVFRTAGPDIKLQHEETSQFAVSARAAQAKMRRSESEQGFAGVAGGQEIPELSGPPPEAGPVETFRRSSPKVGRNDPCPCGSGKKYKKCCGK